MMFGYAWRTRHESSCPRSLRGVYALVASLVMLVGVASTASAQVRYVFEPQAGITIPTGDLADLTKNGPMIGAQLSYQVLPRLAVGVAGSFELLYGKRFDRVTAPDIRMWTYMADVEVELTPPSQPLSLVVEGNVGSARFVSDYFRPVRATQDSRLNEAYLSFGGGVKLGYAFSQTSAFWVGVKAVRASVDSADTAIFGPLSDEHDLAFENTMTFPVSIGIRVGAN